MTLAAGFFSSGGSGPEFLVGLAVLGGLWSLFKGVPKLTGAIARIDGAARAIVGSDDHPGVVDRIKAVESELKPNGGGSFRDVVNRVETGVLEAKGLAKTVADQLAITQQAAQEAAQAAHDDRSRIELRLQTNQRSNEQRVEALMNALDGYAQERYAKDEYQALREVAYVRALKAMGLDLTDIATELDEESP